LFSWWSLAGSGKEMQSLPPGKCDFPVQIRVGSPKSQLFVSLRWQLSRIVTKIRMQIKSPFLSLSLSSLAAAAKSFLQLAEEEG